MTMPNQHGRKWIRDDKRLAIYLRDGLHCVWCCKCIEHGIGFTLDHVKCRKKAPNNEAKNLITACHECNSRRRDLDVAHFAALIADEHASTGMMILARVNRLRARSLSRFRAQAKLMLMQRGLTETLDVLKTGGGW
jgi:hypothetical protein